MPEWMLPEAAAAGIPLRSADAYEMGKLEHYADFAVEPFPLVHDAPNCGYKIFYADGRSALVATDTNSLDGIEARDFTLYLVEANYGEREIAERIRAKREEGAYCYELGVLRNHLSEEKAMDWLCRNMGPESRYALLHRHEERPPGGGKASGAEAPEGKEAQAWRK